MQDCPRGSSEDSCRGERSALVFHPNCQTDESREYTFERSWSERTFRFRLVSFSVPSLQIRLSTRESLRLIQLNWRGWWLQNWLNFANKSRSFLIGSVTTLESVLRRWGFELRRCYPLAPQGQSVHAMIPSKTFPGGGFISNARCHIQWLFQNCVKESSFLPI